MLRFLRLAESAFFVGLWSSNILAVSMTAQLVRTRGTALKPVSPLSVRQEVDHVGFATIAVQFLE